MRSRKLRRVCTASRTRISPIVTGRVELVSTYIVVSIADATGYDFLPYQLSDPLFSLRLLCKEACCGFLLPFFLRSRRRFLL